MKGEEESVLGRVREAPKRCHGWGEIGPLLSILGGRLGEGPRRT